MTELHRRPVDIHRDLVDTTLHDGTPFALSFSGLPKDARVVGAEFMQDRDCVRLWFVSAEWDSDSDKAVGITSTKVPERTYPG